MAFGGSGFSFGANNNNNNNNNQSTGFGGFGNTSNTAGFGASTTNTGFGASTTGTNPFGGGTSTFGSNTGGFGSNNAAAGTSLFGGNKPATTNPFGSTTGTTSLFGGNANNTTAATTSTGGFGGFGGGTNTGGFGANNTATNNNNTASGFTFGNNANKPAFGSSTTTPLFGAGGAGTTGGFGGGSGAFGSAGTGTALNQPVGPSDGTASTPFAPTSDKEPNGVTNSYQSIVFQPPYQKYSFEELRLADYNAGRQFGNGSGQAGGFGSNTFGGFGNNASSTFGNNNNTTTPFGGGAATTASTGFGSNTATTGFGGSGGLFSNNASKPGGLFGGTTSSGTTGGLFATTNNNTSTGFGATNTGFGANASTGGGLFGGNNQSKPAGGLFGGAATTGTNNAFSFNNNNNNNNNATTGNTGGGLFGGTNTNTNTGGGLFGSNNNTTQQPAAGGLFSGNTGTNSLFNKPNTGFGASTTQSQPGGLFGGGANTNTNTGTSGGLFGGNTAASNTNNSGGLFGSGNNNTGGGLFGGGNNNNQTGQKSLFGGGFGTNAGANTGGGLFGGTNNATTQPSGGLFGGGGNNSTSGGFNFANNANKPATSLFGGSNSNQQQGGLFNSTNNNNSLFGQSQNTQNNQQQQDGVKHATLLDPNPYGQSSIWTGLPQPNQENAKPVFTPLTATQKMKESTMKPPPSLRLNQSRYMTPPRRNGFGFSYSTYGTPNSAASTPGGGAGGLSGSMYGSRGFSGGSFGRSFNKSASVQNLRSQFTSDSDDIWKPGAFASTHRNSGGSIKRLTIDRTIRNDLFSRPSLPALPGPEQNTAPPTTTASGATRVNGETHQDTTNKLKKRVSFENGTSGGLQNSHLNGDSGALVRTETDDEDRMEDTNGRTNSTNVDGQSRSKDLAVVHEDRESHHISSPPPNVHAKPDPKPGEYWMSPSRAEQAKLPRDRLQNFRDFQVGRYGCGQVTFNGTVDLTALSLDSLYDKIVEIRLRSVTVYPDASSKPPVGRGLNVPSTIVIENSWPRARNQPSSATSGALYDKHIQRLKKMAGTEFVNYESATGIWTFRVPHYTRYGLDYDDEDDEMSELTAPPDSIEKSAMEVDLDDFEDGNDQEDEDDTFAFKQKFVPGGFGRQSAIDYEPKTSTIVQSTNQDDASDHSVYSDEELPEDEPSMVGSYPTPSAPNLQSPGRPILRASIMGTPGKPLLDFEGDWAEQLQRTISPRKQNRNALRETQNKILLDRVYSPIKPKPIEKKDFRTSIDVMNSLFGLPNESGNKGRKIGKATEPDFEFPYAKRAKTFDPDLQRMDKNDLKWHESFKTHFSTVGDLISRKRDGETNLDDEDYVDQEILDDRSDSIVKSSLSNNSQSQDLQSVLTLNDINLQDGVPFAQHKALPFSYLAEHLKASIKPNESDLFNLLHILFDDYEDESTDGLPSTLRQQYEPQIRRDRLTKFLSSYVKKRHADKLATYEKENLTAAALIRLTAKDIKGACDALEKSKNYKLMVLVSQLGNADETFQDDIKAQIDAWRDQRVLSEIKEDVRAIYEICAGNTTVSVGKSGSHVPVEDKAETFNIGDEYSLDWVQSFALGLWYGREEKKHATSSGVVSIQNAVLEFEKRCQRKEEYRHPGDDPLWVALKLYASTMGVKAVEPPVFPTALEALNKTWDASKAFRLHFAIIADIDGVLIDEDAEQELTGLLAYQLSSRGDIAGATYALVHLRDSSKREAMLKSLLERFAGKIPDPPSEPAANVAVATDAENQTQVDKPSPELWTVLTQQLMLPEAWVYRSKALHARAASGDFGKELRYLIAAKSWNEAHECFIRRVAPTLVVDDETKELNDTVNLFEDDVMEKVSGWEMGGGVYADYALMCTAKGQLNQAAVEGLRKRLVELGRRFKKDVNLSTLPVEELEERVAIQEMSRVVADKFEGSQKDILELPLTSDQRMMHGIAVAGNHYRGIMAGGEAA